MHYDFKQKLNKIDSQKYRDLLVPEIDWKLNEAQEIFVKIVAQPRLSKKYGFETNQRTIDDIRTIVINQPDSGGQTLTSFSTSSFTCTLPEDYWFFANGKVLATKSPCPAKFLNTREIQHDDNAHTSAFDKSSFEWEVANIRFISTGIRVFSDGTFTPSKLVMDYLKKPRFMHCAQDFDGGTYNTMEGVALTGTVNCELPEGVHREIVDLAVLITTGDLGLSTYNFRKDKLNITS